MRTIETTAVVTPDHILTVTLPPDIPEGPCRVVVVVDRPEAPRPFTDGWSRHNVTLTDPNCTIRREDLYDEDGR